MNKVIRRIKSAYDRGWIYIVNTPPCDSEPEHINCYFPLNIDVDGANKTRSINDVKKALKEEVIEETLGWHIRIKDINKNYVFDGDICKMLIRSIGNRGNFSSLGTFTVVYEECRYWFKNGSMRILAEYVGSMEDFIKTEVVGNIFDNLEEAGG